MTPKLGDKVTFVQPFSPAPERPLTAGQKDETGATLVMDQGLWGFVTHQVKVRFEGPKLHSNGLGGLSLPAVS